ncbi:transporter suffix domain-containing protein [Halodesulfovibrio sp. MK-HDV]|jgi:hypothetical protein|uniref:transporter suffix domain-containing protein n=1 Tax=Halodesulfovibrio sp. MK-HDV TaxID=2599925 RepID=UPI00136BD2DB|nr:transporter suffix domain-containing protein [Halodesulfovibrio sp. MK-HDV]KAF1074558.1 hypothetical protein MKHDV_02633 [Halodesulfovibrio sp. MK-HDV]
MQEHKEKATEPQKPDWNVKLGIGLFAFSIILPLTSIPIVAAIELSTTAAASTVALLLGLAEVCGLAAIAVMGKNGYAYLKEKLSRFVKSYTPPRDVSKFRYSIGLIMFSIPLIVGWIAPYLFALFPDLAPSNFTWALVGDALFLASLFVLGGNFWDKLNSLFVHNAHATFNKK